MTDNFVAKEYRELTNVERELIEWLITNSGGYVEKYISQLNQAKVVGRCTCGCPTIDIALAGKRSRTSGASTIVAEAEGQSPQGVPLFVILHAREGELSELEVCSLDDVEKFGLPTPEMLAIRKLA